MNGLHRHALRHRWAAAWLIAAALLLRALVPAGYMVGESNGAITIELCSGYGPIKVAMAMPGMAHHGDDHRDRHDVEPCAFGGLTAPALGGVDPLLLVAAIAFIFAAVFRAPSAPAPRSAPRLRPPLRGPPARP